MISKQQLGKALRHYRKQKGLTQQQLVAISNVRGVGMIELGHRWPQPETVVALCKALGIDESALYSPIYPIRRKGRK